MAAILQTSGPVSTLVAIRQNWRFVRNCSTSTVDFAEAASSLTEMGLGFVVNVGAVTNRSASVFVKRSPEEVMELLGANPDLCDPGVYKERYNQRPPMCIGLALRGKLVSMKLVNQKQLM